MLVGKFDCAWMFYRWEVEALLVHKELQLQWREKPCLLLSLPHPPQLGLFVYCSRVTWSRRTRVEAVQGFSSFTSEKSIEKYCRDCSSSRWWVVEIWGRVSISYLYVGGTVWSLLTSPTSTLLGPPVPHQQAKIVSLSAFDAPFPLTEIPLRLLHFAWVILLIRQVSAEVSLYGAVFL